ncbi:MAG: beta-ketoacyl-[acyl-carrier-protein] synthase family protein [Planctomycetota bacterium]|jgi:3-oxoacyl-[acyl-carrier-protein] synthase II
MSDERKRVVVTGVGAVTPMASNVEGTWKGLIEGRSAVDYTTLFDASTFPTTFSGQIRDESVIERFADDPVLSHAGRNVKFALAAAEQACDDSGIERAEVAPERFGVYLGAGEGPPDWMTCGRLFGEAWTGNGIDSQAFLKSGISRLDKYRELFQEPNMPAGLLANRHGARGPNLTCLTACAASSQAIGEGTMIIRRGDADVMLVGGAHSMLHPFGLGGFSLLTALSRRNDDPGKASRPFDRERDGFVLSEGAAILVIEELDHALERGAEIYGEVLGYGTTGDAYRVTDMHPEGRSAKAAMQMALSDAALPPEAIGYVNTHGTSTAVNDRVETIAIKEVFGDHAKGLPISSIKSMLGHLIAGAGAMEAIACLLAIRDGVIPPTINYENPDPELDLDCVPNRARKADLKVAMSNSFGFGGQNIALVLGRYPL